MGLNYESDPLICYAFAKVLPNFFFSTVHKLCKTVPQAFSVNQNENYVN